jgi:hypothetical protein
MWRWNTDISFVFDPSFQTYLPEHNVKLLCTDVYVSQKRGKENGMSLGEKTQL